MKCNFLQDGPLRTQGRSREGARIEILKQILTNTLTISRSREGAWIEIPPPYNKTIRSERRSREGAWIEIDKCFFNATAVAVAPARERGLKLQILR